MYYSDKPITTASEDKLERSNFSKTFAKTIFELEQIDTFTVGLFGKWGSGKTSIVNMMLSELQSLKEKNHSDTIIVRFEPWHFTDSTQLICQFLIRLADEFKDPKTEKLSKIGQALTKYSSAFELAECIPIPYVNTAISKVGKFSLDIIGKKLQKNIEQKDILKQKEYVVELLKKNNKRILIVIDDIDRLSNEQIRQVFQLVASVAKFPNTTYLLVFDKEIVIKALEKVQEGAGNDYLEKIIQVPIQIPELKGDKFFQLLFEKLDEIIHNYPDVTFNRERWNKLFNACIAPFICTIRDINRLLNLIQFKFSGIPSDVDFSDMVALASIEINLPKVYNWIKSNKVLVTGSVYDWSEAFGRKKTSQEWYDKYNKEFIPLINDNNEKTYSVDNALKCVAALFPPFGTKIGVSFETVDRKDSRKNNYIFNEDKFDRYFNLDIEAIGIRRDFIEYTVFSSTLSELVVAIDDAIENNYIYEVLEEISARVDDLNSERAEIIAQALLHSICLMNDRDKKTMFGLGSKSNASHIAYSLFNKIDFSKRVGVLNTIILNMTINNIDGIAEFINMIELAYGRLAAKGQERTGYEKIISLQDLEEAEKNYMKRCVSILGKESLFSAQCWRMAFYLMNSFDKDYTATLMSKELEIDTNVIKYLREFVGEWEGSGISYEVRMPLEYVSKERILEAICNLKQNRELYSLDDGDQHRAVAFYIALSDENNLGRHIPESETIKLLSEWKKGN